MPSVLDLERMFDSENLGGRVSEIAAATGANSLLVTAVRTDSGRLRLISWRLNTAGPVTRLDDSAEAAGNASDIAIAAATGASFITACRTAEGHLKLISWNVDAAGQIVRRGDSADGAGEATRIELVCMTQTLIVTACRTEGGNLKLISWRLNANGSITRLADAEAGAISEVSLCRMSGDRVATAVRDGSGDLKIITWSVSAAGVIARLGDSRNGAGRATLIRCVLDPGGRLIAGMRDASGDLKLIAWRVSADGANVVRLGDSGDQAGDIQDLSLSVLPDGVVSGVRTADGTLKLIAWNIDAAGAFARRGDSGDQAGRASNIQMVTGPGVVDAAGHSVSMATAVRTASGRIKIITWGPPCVHVHFKVLVEPIVPRAQMLQGMRDVYASVGIGVVLASEEMLDLPELQAVEIGTCSGEVTADQTQLFANRNNVGAGEVVVYFVQATDPVVNGCASSPSGRPAAIVVQQASPWTLGHEVGHLLGLRHVNDNRRLMTGNGTGNIVDTPPDLVPSEQSQMVDNRFTIPE